MNLMLVDDHPLIREAVRAAVSQHDSVTRFTTFSTLDSCLQCLRDQESADLVLLDLGLSGFTGIGALEEFRLQCPSIPVVVLSGQEERQIVLDCLDAGAMGYIPKSFEQSVMMAAVRLVASGGVFIPPLVLRHGNHCPVESPAANGHTDTSATVSGRAQDPKSLGLTERQFGVLRLLVRGLPNKLIARELDLSENTVKTHVSAVLQTIGVQTRTQAVLAAGRLGIRV